MARSNFTESIVEDVTLAWLDALGYAVLHGPDIAVGEPGAERSDPYSYRGQAYRRVGNTSTAMSRDEYNRMLLERLHGERRWENQPAEGWDASRLDHREMVLMLEESIRRGRLDDPAVVNAMLQAGAVGRDVGSVSPGLAL